MGSEQEQGDQEEMMAIIQARNEARVKTRVTAEERAEKGSDSRCI